MTKPHIILASASIGRKQLLEKLGVPFSIQISSIDEDIIIHQNPYKMLQMRATAKAEDVVQRLSSWRERQQPIGSLTYQNDSIASLQNDYLVIAADSMAVLGNKTYGKAKNKTHAKKIVSELMGKTHEFVTATSIIHFKFLKSHKSLKETHRWENLTKTHVTLRKLTNNERTQYVNRYDFTRFAAGYALGETPWDLVTRIDGSYTNVIGLPFEVVLEIFTKLSLL